MCGDNMEHNRKQKFLMIIALVLSIASLSIGFAAFTVSLNISSEASVTPNSDTFSVKFSTNKDSLVVASVTPSSKTGNITTSDGVIDNSTNPTIKNLSATFTQPGQYVEYTFYARNEGEYTAYLNNINFLGSKTCKAETGTTDSLVQSACESINITATIGNTTYTETTPITKHTLAKKTGEQIKVRLEYDSNGTTVDGAFSIKLPNVALVYSTLDDSSIEPTKVVRLVSGNLNDPGSIVAIGNEEFYVIGQENGIVKLFSKMNVDVNSLIQSSSATGTPYGPGGNGRRYCEYSGSYVEGYVNNYASYLEGLGVNIEEARLITKEEIIDAGCEVNQLCREGPSLVKDFSALSYWTGTCREDSDYQVWIFHVNHGLITYHFAEWHGLRPVIEISLSEF